MPSQTEIQDICYHLETTRDLLKTVAAEFSHLSTDAYQTRAALAGLIEWLQKPNQGKDEFEEVDEEGIDYEDWVATQPWPEGATHATLDKQGGCCWWKLKPVRFPSYYGWEARRDGGELIERFYDPAQPFSGPKWRDSLREKPQETSGA